MSIAIDENEILLTYFDGIKASLQKEEYNDIKDSIEHIDGGYLVGVWAPEFVTCSTVLKAQETGAPVSLCCAIGDTTVDGKLYADIVAIARKYIEFVGGFEKFAEWGLI